MDTAHLTELVRRMRLDNPTVTVDCDAHGAATVVWQESGLDHPLVLLVRERDLAAAVAALAADGLCLWPGAVAEDAGLNLLLVHLDEVIATRDTSEPLRLTAHGLHWPEAPRQR